MTISEHIQQGLIIEEKKFAVGQHVFVISNNSFFMEMEIVRISGDFYTLRSVEHYGSGVRLKKHRLFATKEEAEAVMKNWLPEQ